MSMPTIKTKAQLLRSYARRVERALVTLPVGPVRNEAVTALAGVDQKLAELRDSND